MLPLSSLFLLLSILIFPAKTFAQKTNAYQFIEPNISINYDSNHFKVGERYSNTFYETEAYDFNFIKNHSNNTRIHIEASYPTSNVPSIAYQDSFIQSKIGEIIKMDGREITLIDYDKKVRNINDVLCVGFVISDNKTKQNSTTIICNHITDNDMTQINYIASNSKNLDSNYAILQEFITGFNSYSAIAIAKEDSIIKSIYTVTINPTKDTIDNFKWRNNVYLGIVSTKEPLRHKIKEVRLQMNSYSKEIFTPATDSGVPIICQDKTKGTIKKEGELVLLNSFGKTVKLPFSFTYENR